VGLRQPQPQQELTPEELAEFNQLIQEERDVLATESGQELGQPPVQGGNALADELGLPQQEFGEIDIFAAPRPTSPTKPLSDFSMEDFKKQLEGLPEAGLEALPIAGGIAGGAIAGGLTSPTGPGAIAFGVGGATLGAAGGQAAADALRGFFELETAPKTTGEAFLRAGAAGLEAAAGEGTGQVVGKGIALGARGVGGALRAGRGLLEKGLTPGVQRVVIAARNLGVKLPERLKNNSRFIRDLEQSLATSPTVASTGIRKTEDAFFKGLTGRAEEVTNVPNNLSAFEVGESVKTGLIADIGEATAPAQATFQLIDSKLSSVPVPDSLKRGMIRSVKSSPGANLTTGGGRQIAKRIESDIQQLQSISDIKILRTTLRQELSNPNLTGTQKTVIAKALDKLTSARDLLVKNTGDADLREALSFANKSWKAFFNKFERIDKALGGKAARSPSDLVSKIDGLNAEQIQKKLFNINDVATLKAVEEIFPRQFETMRIARMNELIKKSSKAGEISLKKLVTNISKMPKEFRKVLFGKDLDKVADIETLINAIPDALNPSGTARQLEITRIFNLIQQGSALGRLALLRGLTAPKPSNIVDRLIDTAGGAEALFGKASFTRSGVGQAIIQPQIDVQQQVESLFDGGGQ